VELPFAEIKRLGMGPSEVLLHKLAEICLELKGDLKQRSITGPINRRRKRNMFHSTFQSDLSLVYSNSLFEITVSKSHP